MLIYSLLTQITPLNGLKPGVASESLVAVLTDVIPIGRIELEILATFTPVLLAIRMDDAVLSEACPGVVELTTLLTLPPPLSSRVVVCFSFVSGS